MNLVDFVDDIVVEVPAVLEPTALSHLIRAARQFCRDSRIWQREFSIYTVKGVDGYSVSPADSGTVLDVEWLALEGRYLDGRHSTALVGNSDPEASRGRPETYHLFEGDRIVFTPIPDGSHIVTGVQSLIPPRGSDEIPDWMADQWGEALVALTSANLMTMPNKDWTDPSASQIHFARYAQLVQQAKKFALGENRRATREVSYGGL